MEGHGCEKATKDSLYWLTLAANQGSPGILKLITEAYCSLGYMIEQVPGKTFDSVSLFLCAANSGLVLAQFKLAKMYLKGNGTPKDLVQAEYWFKKAALQNNNEAQFNLSSIIFDSRQNLPTGSLK